MNSVGARIRAARLARGLTQAQLAQGLATKGFICQVERDHAMPSLPKLRLLADRLGLPLSDLVTSSKAPLQQLTYLRKSAELALRADECERAMTMVDEALPLATTADERADLQRLRGIGLTRLGRHAEALSALQLAAATAPDDPDLSAAIYVEIGTIHHLAERLNAAFEANLRAMAWLERSRHPDPELLARLLTNLGVEAAELGQPAEGLEYFQRALAAATDAESLFRLANAHMALGIAAREAGNLDRAIEHCNRALELHRRIGQKQVANRVLNNLGDAHRAAGRLREATDLQRQCLNVARELHDTEEVAIAAGALASYALQNNDLAEATALARESQAAAQAAGNHLHLAGSLAVEGLAAERQNRRMVANRCFREAFRLLLERHAVRKLAEISRQYSDVLRDRGDVDRAFALMRMAADRDFAGLPGFMRNRSRE